MDCDNRAFRKFFYYGAGGKWLKDIEERSAPYWRSNCDRLIALKKVFLALHDGVLWTPSRLSEENVLVWTSNRDATALQACTTLDKLIRKSEFIHVKTTH